MTLAVIEEEILKVRGYIAELNLVSRSGEVLPLPELADRLMQVKQVMRYAASNVQARYLANFNTAVEVLEQGGLDPYIVIDAVIWDMEQHLEYLEFKRESLIHPETILIPGISQKQGEKPNLGHHLAHVLKVILNKDNTD